MTYTIIYIISFTVTNCYNFSRISKVCPKLRKNSNSQRSALIRPFAVNLMYCLSC